MVQAVVQGAPAMDLDLEVLALARALDPAPAMDLAPVVLTGIVVMAQQVQV